jgi:hypothetical protein
MAISNHTLTLRISVLSKLSNVTVLVALREVIVLLILKLMALLEVIVLLILNCGLTVTGFTAEPGHYCVACQVTQEEPPQQDVCVTGNILARSCML